MNYCKILFLFLFLFAPNLYAHKIETWPLSLKKAQDAVARIEKYDTQSSSFKSLASGFFVQKNDLFATNAHVLSNILSQNPKNIKNTLAKARIFKKGKSYPIKSVKNISIVNDLALLEIEGFSGPFLEISASPLPRRVYIIGFPQSRLRQIKANTFDFYLSRDHYTLFPHILGDEILGGLSGSPVLNTDGQVMGIVSQSRPWYISGAKSLPLKQLMEKNPITNIPQTIQKQMSSLLAKAKKGDKKFQHKLSELFINNMKYFLDLTEFSILDQIEHFFHPERFYFDQAVKWSQQAARQEHAIAQFNLAGIYLNGIRGLFKDYSDKQAYQWASRAAVNRFPYAEFLLGFYMYKEGVGTPIDEKKAFNLTHSAALNGHSRAAFELGVFYLNEYSSPADKQKAISWIKTSAGMGSPLAQFVLGLLSFKGIFLEQDNHKALHFFEQAARSGHNPSQFMLGVMLTQELNTEENKLSAQAWLAESMLEGRFTLWADFLRGALPSSINIDPQTAEDLRFIKWIVYDENTSEMDLFSVIQLVKNMDGPLSF